jgi:ribosomal protein L40E
MKRYLCVMGLTESPLCRRCGARKETSARVLRTCEALVTLRHHYLGSFSLDPEDVRNLALESSWVFIKGQNCHDLDFSSKGHKVPV